MSPASDRPARELARRCLELLGQLSPSLVLSVLPLSRLLGSSAAALNVGGTTDDQYR